MNKHVFKQIVGYVHPYYKAQMIGLFITLLYSTTIFLTPLISKHLIDNVIGTTSINGLFSGIILFCLVCLAQPITSFAKDLIFIKIGERTASDIRKSMYKGILYAPFRDIENKSTGEIVSRISQDGYMASRIISDLAVGIIKNIVICVMIICGLIMLSPVLSILSITLFLLSMLLTSKLSSEFEGIQAEVQVQHDTLCKDVSSLVGAASLIKGYSLEEKFDEAFDEVLEDVKQINTKAMIHNAKIQNISNAIMVLILCILYGGGSILVLYGQMTIGTVIGLGLYFQLLMQPAYELMHQKSAIHKAIPILERIEEYESMGAESHETSESEADRKSLIGGLASIGGLCIENLSFSYGEKKVINNMSINFPSKGLVIVEGESGTGKSTLFKILSGLYYPDTGRIYVKGTLREHMVSFKYLRKLVSHVDQQPKRHSCIDEKLHRSKGILNEKERNFVEALENSFIESSEESIYSGGEMQRQALLNTIYKQTPIWLLDEPLSALDSCNKNLIIDHVLV